MKCVSIRNLPTKYEKSRRSNRKPIFHQLSLGLAIATIIFAFMNSASAATDWSKKIKFNFENQPILKVVKSLSEHIDKKFLISGVKGEITVINQRKISVKDAFSVFRAALTMQGYNVLETERYYKIQISRQAQRDQIETFVDDIPEGDERMVSKIFRLKHISADEVNKSLRIIPSKDGEMAPYREQNAIILTDYVGNVNRVSKILKEIDVPPTHEWIRPNKPCEKFKPCGKVRKIEKGSSKKR